MSTIKPNNTGRRRADRYPKNRWINGQIGKRVPNSFASSLRAIRRFWKVDKNAPPRLPEEFAEDFQEHFQKIIALYPGPGADKAAGNLKQLAERIESGRHDIRYYEMRAYSEYVGIPLGLLMLFSHVLGDAAGGHTKNEVLNLLQSTIQALASFRDYVTNDTEYPKKLFDAKEADGNRPRYNALIDGLEVMEAAYRSTRTRPALLAKGLTG